MSANQLKQSEPIQPPTQARPGNGAWDESALIDLYRNITQENELQARSVFMFVVRANEEPNTGQ
jgi:hypothetical protein